MSKVDLVLNWLIIISSIILIITIITIPKDGCDMCKFGDMNGNEFFNNYSKKCLTQYNAFDTSPQMSMEEFRKKLYPNFDASLEEWEESVK